MSLVLNVEILGEFKNLTKATKGAQSELSKMNAKASKVSAGITKAFAAIGIGFSLNIIKRELEEAAKAAIEDEKSMTLLATAMENTGKASKIQVAEAEKAIKSMQLQSAVADDDLRPAYQKLFIATGNVTESNKLLQVALDASAGSGKSLDAVSQAMAKSLAGSDTALFKLIPSLKGAKDPMAELAATFEGAAAAAANTDPYQRMQIIFGEMQEQIGMALLPVLDKFSTWLATPEGQAKLQEIVDGFVAIITEGGKLVAWVIDNKDWLVPMVTAIAAVTAAWKLATIAVQTYQTVAGIAAAIGIGGAVIGGGAIGAGVGGFQQGQTNATTSQIYGQGFKQLGSSVLGSKGTTVNVNVKTVTDAKQVIKTVSQFQKATGTTLAQALR
jgi:hypothetical protein